MVIRKKRFNFDTLLGQNKQITLTKYDSPLTMVPAMVIYVNDKIDNIRPKFSLLEANLPSCSFLYMDYIVSRCISAIIMRNIKRNGIHALSRKIVVCKHNGLQVVFKNKIVD